INALDTLTYGDPDVSLLTTSSSGLVVSDSSDNPAVATIVNHKIHIIRPGMVHIIATQPGNKYFAAATSIERLIIINKAPQTITFNALPTLTFSDTSFYPSASSTSGLPVAFASDNLAVASIYNGEIQIHSAGVVHITASQVGNVDYDTAINVIQLLTINKANQVLTFNPLPPKVYGDADF